jgi:adenylate kinase
MKREGRLVVVLLGGPGAGKGTQAQIVLTWLQIPHISTGQMLRSEMAQHTRVGKRVKTLVESGALVDDATIDSLVARRIRLPDCRNGFILDGYPRNVRQAVAFQDELKPEDRLVVIDIAINPADIMKRLARRNRSDDREDVIRLRFEIYHRETMPVSEYYKQRSVYHVVDGMKPPGEVAESIATILRTASSSEDPGWDSRCCFDVCCDRF